MTLITRDLMQKRVSSLTEPVGNHSAGTANVLRTVVALRFPVSEDGSCELLLPSSSGLLSTCKGAVAIKVTVLLMNVGSADLPHVRLATAKACYLAAHGSDLQSYNSFGFSQDVVVQSSSGFACLPRSAFA